MYYLICLSLGLFLLLCWKAHKYRELDRCFTHLAKCFSRNIEHNKKLLEQQRIFIDCRRRLPLKGEMFKVLQMGDLPRKVTRVSSGAHSDVVIEYEIRGGTTNEKIVAVKTCSYDEWMQYVTGVPTGAVSLGVSNDFEKEATKEYSLDDLKEEIRLLRAQG